MPTAKEVSDACAKVMQIIDAGPATVELGLPPVEYVIPAGWLPGMLLIAADGSAVVTPHESAVAAVVEAMEAHAAALCDATLQTVRDGLATRMNAEDVKAHAARYLSSDG